MVGSYVSPSQKESKELSDVFISQIFKGTTLEPKSQKEDLLTQGQKRQLKEIFTTEREKFRQSLQPYSDETIEQLRDVTEKSFKDRQARLATAKAREAQAASIIPMIKWLTGWGAPMTTNSTSVFQASLDPNRNPRHWTHVAASREYDRKNPEFRKAEQIVLQKIHGVVTGEGSSNPFDVAKSRTELKALRTIIDERIAEQHVREGEHN